MVMLNLYSAICRCHSLSRSTRTHRVNALWAGRSAVLAEQHCHTAEYESSLTLSSSHMYSLLQSFPRDLAQNHPAMRYAILMLLLLGGGVTTDSCDVKWLTIQSSWNCCSIHNWSWVWVGLWIQSSSRLLLLNLFPLSSCVLSFDFH